MERAEVRKRVLRIMVIEFLGLIVLSAFVGLAVGLSQHSTGWGFAGAMMCDGLLVVLSLVVLAVRGQLRRWGRLYAQAFRNTLGRGLGSS